MKHEQARTNSQDAGEAVRVRGEAERGEMGDMMTDAEIDAALAVCEAAEEECDFYCQDVETRGYIDKARDGWPRALRELKAERERSDKLRGFLKSLDRSGNFVKHHSSCDHYLAASGEAYCGPCDCGLTALRNEIADTVEEPSQ